MTSRQARWVARLSTRLRGSSNLSDNQRKTPNNGAMKLAKVPFNSLLPWKLSIGQTARLLAANAAQSEMDLWLDSERTWDLWESSLLPGMHGEAAYVLDMELQYGETYLSFQTTIGRRLGCVTIEITNDLDVDLDVHSDELSVDQRRWEPASAEQFVLAWGQASKVFNGWLEGR